MADCAALAERLGERAWGRELGDPGVPLRAGGARTPSAATWRTCAGASTRGWRSKLTDPAWAPDFGPTAFNPKSGATIIGAREFLIAYNVTLNSTDKNHATDIAFELREKGRVARRGRTTPYYYKGDVLTYAPGRFPCGQCDFDGATADEIRQHTQSAHGYDLDALLRLNDLTPGDLVGLKVHRAGLFKACKAIGWYVDDYKRAQISINLTNYRLTAPHDVLDAARRLAAERGLVVTGSEIVGAPALRRADGERASLPSGAGAHGRAAAGGCDARGHSLARALRCTALRSENEDPRRPGGEPPARWCR
jgi:glutamate formiminotransferase/formiminotetrahydrofolate cyclodeaminase